MLIDEARITVSGGHGGAGKVAFYPGKLAGPSGGNGGRGGNVYFKFSSDLTLLNQFSAKTKFSAGNGQPGGSFRKTGEDGKDIYLTLPLGIEITNLETGDLFELNDLNQEVLIGRGGLGGRGNYELRSSRNTTPMNAQSGLEGEEKTLKLVLKLIADFGLIGLPSSGKTSLLNELTQASGKVGDYPFTTLEPNLGVLKNPKGKNLIMADIPGLIEGASEGKGLGIKFLKHIEKVKVLLHCISTESGGLVKDYQIIREELKKFNPELLDKKEVILLTKSDLTDQKLIKEKIKILSKVNKSVIPVSIYDYDSIEELKVKLTELTR